MEIHNLTRYYTEDLLLNVENACRGIKLEVMLVGYHMDKPAVGIYREVIDVRNPGDIGRVVVNLSLPDPTKETEALNNAERLVLVAGTPMVLPGFYAAMLTQAEVNGQPQSAERAGFPVRWGRTPGKGERQAFRQYRRRIDVRSIEWSIHTAERDRDNLLASLNRVEKRIISLGKKLEGKKQLLAQGEDRDA